MLSVIIPTEGVEQLAVATLAALVPGAAAGVVREVLLVDRAGTGVIERVADVAGCRFLAFQGTHAAALAAGARKARLAMADVPARRARADPGLIEGDHAVHPGCREQRPAPRRHSLLRPLALCRHNVAGRFQVRRPHDRFGPSAEQGFADRARPLRPARGLSRPMPAVPRPGLLRQLGCFRAPCRAAGSWLGFRPPPRYSPKSFNYFDNGNYLG